MRKNRKVFILVTLALALIIVGVVCCLRSKPQEKEAVTQSLPAGTWRLQNVSYDNGNYFEYAYESCSVGYLEITEDKIDFYNIFDDGTREHSERFATIEGERLFLSKEKGQKRGKEQWDNDIQLSKMELVEKGTELFLKRTLKDGNEIHSVYKKVDHAERIQCYDQY